MDTKEAQNNITNDILIPSEFARLFDTDWREAAIYGGRGCFARGTMVQTNNGYVDIASLKVGDKVLSKEGVYDKIIEKEVYPATFDPKPIIDIEINGTVTSATYDHKYFNGRDYVPLYKLIWRIMDASQRRTLELLCKQYGQTIDYEVQRRIQDKSDEASGESERIPSDSGWRQSSTSAPHSSQDIHPEPYGQGNNQSQEWHKDRQQGRKYGVDDKSRECAARLGYWAYENIIQDRAELSKAYGRTSKRIITIPLGSPDNANKDNGRVPKQEAWLQLSWDTGFAEWQNVEDDPGRISTQKTDSLASSKQLIRVVGVRESIETHSIGTEKHHNYFANGVNVSNSLKSHTVARVLLVRAMQKRGRCGCFREFQNSIADSSHSLLKNLIEQYRLPNFKVTNDSIVNTVTGYDFIFKGLRNNVQSVKSIEGMTEAWVEEAQTISEQSLDVLTPTVRLPGSQIFYTYNRLKDKDPIHNRLVIEGRPNTLVLNVNYDIAEKYGWLSDVLRLEMESDRDNRPEIYKHKWLGEPANLKGQIYKNWKRIDKIPKEAEYLGAGLDYGYTNDPTALVDVWKWNNAYILDEQLYNKGMQNKEIGQQIVKLPHYSNQVVVGDSSEPKSNDDIKDEGVNIIGATKGKDSVNNGIQLLQGLEIYYTERSHNIEEEVLNYQWKVDKEDKSLNVPIDAYNHAMDAVRYKITDVENFRPMQYAPSR